MWTKEVQVVGEGQGEDGGAGVVAWGSSWWPRAWSTSSMHKAAMIRDSIAGTIVFRPRDR